MEGLVSLVEALFDEGAKHPVLLVAAIEESANMTLVAQTARVKLNRTTLGCHTSPQLRSKKLTEEQSRTQIQMYTAIGVRKSAPRALKSRRRNSANLSAMDRSARP